MVSLNSVHKFQDNRRKFTRANAQKVRQTDGQTEIVTHFTVLLENVHN